MQLDRFSVIRATREFNAHQGSHTATACWPHEKADQIVVGEKDSLLVVAHLPIYSPDGSDGTLAYIVRKAMENGSTVDLFVPEGVLARATRSTCNDYARPLLRRALMTVEERVQEEYGVSLETTSRLKPFKMIICPLCGGTKFTCLDMASAWCDNCNARIDVRSTVGDPGCCLDCYAEYVSSRDATLIVPRGTRLAMTIKDFGYTDHPSGACCDTCPNVHTDEERRRKGVHVPLSRSLRPGLPQCGAEVYDWKITNRRRDDPHDNVFVKIDLENGAGPKCHRWPDDLAYEEPPATLLGDGQKYLLLEVIRKRNGRGVEFPLRNAWIIVEAVEEEVYPGSGPRFDHWQLIDWVCPSCHEPMGAGEHPNCHARWIEYWDLGWRAPKIKKQEES